MTVASTPNAILVGGPAESLPEASRIRTAGVADIIVKVLHGNRWEHFRRTPEIIAHESGQLSVFAWTGGTYVAE